MRYFRLIITALTLMSVTSCLFDNLELQTSDSNSKDEITIVGRITRFNDCEVQTRGAKEDDELKVTSIAMAIFLVNDAGTAIDGDCVYYDYNEGNQSMFTINRTLFTNYNNRRFVIYAFANIPGMGQFGIGSGLAQMVQHAYSVNASTLDVPSDGFPMMGSIGDDFSDNFPNDGNKLVLRPVSNNSIADPEVTDKDGQKTNQPLLSIPMKALYAKINFTIDVTSKMAGEGGVIPQFEIESYKVCNIPKTVDCDSTTNSVSDVYDEILGETVVSDPASGDKVIKFSFYLPERKLKPTTKWQDYEYPFGKGNGIRNEDLIYRQRYKGKLVEGQKATNVVISGRYRDHQGHYFSVSYTIHLGADAYGDFNILRNTEYDNYITINGIMNSAPDEGSNGNTISVDHRVNIQRTQPAIISLRREMLLDSHFEIRPLRIKNSGIGDVENTLEYEGDDDISPANDKINAVRVEVLDPAVTNWMRLELKNNNGGNRDRYLGNGKRRYFTYNLVNGRNPQNTGSDTSNGSLYNSYAVNVSLNEGNQCVWIYVDECTEAGDGVRSGVVQVTYGNLTNDGSFTATNNPAFPPVKYNINQRKLFKVTNGEYTYYIEYEEEYLHNFDSEESFGETEYEGMEWGLNNVQLSYDNKAISFGDGLTGIVQNAFTQGRRANYDFYVTKHDSNASGTMNNRQGYNFTTAIIQEVNGASGNDKNTANNIDTLSLNMSPESAVEYCYNKNKRYANGQVVSGNSTTQYNYVWYLPAIDQIEDIIMGVYEDAEGSTENSYSRFEDFQNKFYWSSQPAYIRHYAYYRGLLTGESHGPYYTDDVTHARATKVNYNPEATVESEKYKYELSGVFPDTYYTGWYHFEAGFAESDYTVWGENNPNMGNDDYVDDEFTPGNLNIPLGPIQRQSGNKPRTGAGLESMARVRCVRVERGVTESNN